MRNHKGSFKEINCFMFWASVFMTRYFWKYSVEELGHATLGLGLALLAPLTETRDARLFGHYNFVPLLDKASEEFRRDAWNRGLDLNPFWEARL